MKIDNNFIQLISHKETLNKEQFKILGLDNPSEENWKNQALDKEVSRNAIIPHMGEGYYKIWLFIIRYVAPISIILIMLKESGIIKI